MEAQTPAPSAPQTPMPSAPPAPSQSSQPSAPASTPEIDDPFAPPPKATPEPSKQPEKPEAKPAEKDGSKPAEKPSKGLPPDFRKELERVKSEHAKAIEEVNQWKSKIAEFESKGKETSALTAQLDALTKERDDLAGQIRMYKQEASPDFIKKYVEPYNKAFSKFSKELETIAVTDENGERKGTGDDLATLYKLPLGARIRKAKEMFGDASDYVLGQISKLQDMEGQYQEALEQERTQYKEKEQQETARRVQLREQRQKAWQDTNRHLENVIDEYKVDPSDNDAIEARKHALSVFDAKPQGADENDTIKKSIIKNAHIRQRIGAYPVLKLKNQRLETKVAELEAQIAELKGSAPGSQKRPSANVAPSNNDEDWGSGLTKELS